MDPIDTEWATCKSDLVEETNTGNVTRSCVWRELGMDPPNQPPNKTVLENVAEDILVQKPLKIRCCDLPGYPRSTFLMVFSPDGTKVASTHGNHNLYVSELASGKHVRILKGHPRTPWCIAFHPSHPQLIGSGCLGGQVRVWDISSGGSEVWNVQNDMVIASIAFHPREQLLVIATFNELYFWDWSQPAPFTKVSTNSINEKVRYVAFDALGYKLITGISVWNTTNSPASSSVLQQNPTSGPNTARRSPSLPLFHASSISVEPFDNATAPSNADDAEPPGTAQDIIVNSYQSLVQRYDSLVRNYQRLVRNRLTSTPPPNTIDRGTDPMETDVLSSSARTGRPAPRTDDASPGPSTSRSEEPEIADSEGSSRLLNLDALSFGNNPTRNEESRERSSVFGSRSSAFQPLNERSFRPVEQGERSRMLPNPFSAAAGATQSRASATDAEPPAPAAPAPAPASPAPADPAPPEPSTSGAAPPPAATAARAAAPQWPACAVASARASLTTRLRDDIGLPILDMLERRCEQISALGAPGRRPSLRAVDARTITESLDLIRDILRDSGTRLLNLITHMSLSTLAGVPPREPPLHLLSPLRSRDLISDSSDSDSDELELNIRRTRNASFRETASPQPFTAAPTATDRMLFDRASEQARADAGGAGDAAGSSGATPPQTSAGSSRTTPPRASPASAGATPLRATPSTSGAAPPRTSARSDPGDTPPRSTTRVASRDNERRGPRTDGSHSDDSDAPSPVKKSPRRSAAAERLQNGSPGGTPPPPDPDAPSTSRAPPPRVRPSPVDAYRKVRAGVAALQKHTAQLSALWLRGSRTSMRELRVMWEGLRRRVHLLHREARDGPPPYSRSLLERCMMLPDGGSSRTAGRPARPAARRDAGTATEPEPRRRRAHAPRWRAEDELRRRAPRPVPRAAPRPVTRASSRRGDFARALEMSGTRHVVRVRAMQVLSIMFNMMIMCLEDRGLSQLIITMLRTLKKALALTCLMLVSNRHAGRAPGATSQRLDPTSVVRLQRGDEAGPVNVEEEEPAPAPPGARPAPAPATAPAPGPAQRWSDRLAVQIAAANRNTSLTARSRRDLYLESRRQKALHRTDPTAHPLIRKRGLPPASTYRIPALRSLPPSAVSKLKSARAAAPEPRDEPVAGPSHERDDSEGEAPPSDTMVEFQQRINLIRLAHMQAVRFRDAARHRFRRLQTVRGFSLLRPRTTAEPGPFHTAPTAAAAPLMHVNDLPMSFNADDGPPPPPRLARIHEYLQPIILAQNAMVVDEELDINVRNPSGPTPRRLGAMASLLDASIISEALPAPVHRVQAWDFTTGDTPDIADSTKNVVVLRCKIHNDASIDISKDGRLLVALLPVPRLRSTNHWLGVYSLEWSRLGQCLHTAVLEQSAVSVALSPTARHLAVGLGSRRFTTAPHARNNVFAFLYRLEPYESTSCTGLSPIKELEQNWDQGFTSLNCLRWAPQPGQGLVYANNTGQLIIMS